MFPTIYTYLALINNQPSHQVLAASSVQLASRSFSMEDRYDVPSVNTVFKDNILLGLHYMGGDITAKNQISWDNIDKPYVYKFTLQPGEEFAFHDAILPKYTKVVKTTNTHYDSDEGFKSDGFLVGDGVCHFASLIYWAAKDANLESYAPSNHNFAKINDVPKEYGVAIESPMPMGNLYITNNKDKAVTFEFNYDGTNLTVNITEAN